jgi:transposase-like protein
MERRGRYPAEVRERAVRLVFEQQESHPSQWAAITSLAAKMGCTAETLRHWVRQAERDAGTRPGLTSSQRVAVRRPTPRISCEAPPPAAAVPGVVRLIPVFGGPQLT